MKSNSSRPPELVKAEIYIGYLLRYGVILCALVIASGVFMSFLWPNASRPHARELLVHVLNGEDLKTSPVPTSAKEFSERLSRGEPTAIIAVGLLLLILLPIFRVATALVLFLIERDVTYILISAIVLSVLLCSLFLGKSL